MPTLAGKVVGRGRDGSNPVRGTQICHLHVCGAPMQ